MSDTVSRFLLENLDIRGAVVHLDVAWQAMQAGRDYAPAARDLLGQMAAVTALIGSNLKTPGRLSFQVQGHGALRLMVVDCDEQLRLRGLAKLSDEAPTDLASAPIPALLGDGQLVLTLQTNAALDRPYQSFVPLQGDTVAEIFEHYLETSEQAPSRLWLMADGTRACGLFLQKLPDADKKDEDGWNRIQMLADTVKTGELALPAEELLGRLFPEEDVRLFSPSLATYHCPRDEEKVLNMLRSLGREELAGLLAEKGEIVILDDICNHTYRYGPEVLDQLYPPIKRTLH
ncbi:MAG: Hsp33 family molecular chaperone HslO [Rhodocyclaceae bacterium]|nr:MAG: Hsp33 family molecular chaperone HslO [Rhodocyclaceae bacterium]